MCIWNYHQMTVGIGVPIQHDVGFRATVQNQVVFGARKLAKEAFGRVGVSFDVFHTPGRPDSVH